MDGKLTAHDMDKQVNGFAVIIDEHNRVLLSRWVEGRRPAWTLPGGIINDGENPRNAAARFLTAETGLIGDVAAQPFAVTSRIVPANRRPRGGGEVDVHIVNFLYFAEITGGALTPSTDGRTDEVAWFPIDALPESRTKLVSIAIDRALSERAQPQSGALTS